jgi:hypothetical protein
VVPTVIDLTTAGSTGTIGNALFEQFAWPPAGQGAINPFLKINSNQPVEQGYNTDYTPVQFDEVASFTHSLQLGSVPIVIAGGGVPYYEFLLDINQSSKSPNNLLSLDDLRFYVVSPSAMMPNKLHNYIATTKTLQDGAGVTYSPVYDLNPASNGNYVKLDATLSSGSGTGDMVALIPVSTLGSDPNMYVYLYSKFGVHYGNTSGAEEWVTSQALPVGSISGQTFVDANGNGSLDSGEPGQAGVTVYLDANNNGQLDPGEASTVTAANGTFSFTGVTAGTYHVREVVPNSYVQTAKLNADVTLTGGQNATGVAIGNFKLVTIGGTVFEDTTGNGFSTDDPALGTTDLHYVQVTIQLYKGGTSVGTTKTDTNGNYSFTNLGPGTYTVSEQTPTGWVQTTATGATIVAASGQDSAKNNFDVFKLVSISGTEYKDLTGNGFSADDPVLNKALPDYVSVTVQLLGSTQTPTTTDGNGNYIFAGVGPGTFTLTEVNPSGWVKTAVPAVFTTTSGIDLTGENFDLFKAAVLNPNNGVLALSTTQLGSGSLTVNQANNSNAFNVSISTPSDSTPQTVGTFTQSTVSNVQITSFAGSTVNTQQVVTAPVTIFDSQGKNNNYLAGSSGTNLFLNNNGTETVNLAGGTNSLNFSNNSFGVNFNANLSTTQSLDGSGTTHLLTVSGLGSFQNLVGSPFNDTLYAAIPTVPATGVNVSTLNNYRTSVDGGGGGTDTLYGTVMTTMTATGNSNSTMYSDISVGVDTTALQTLFGEIISAAGTNPSTAQTLFGDLSTVMSTTSSGNTTMFGDVLTTMNGGSGANVTMYGGIPATVTGLNLGTLFSDITNLAATNPTAAQTMFGDLTTVMNAGTGTTTMFGDVMTAMNGGSSANVTMYGGIPATVTGLDLGTLFSDLTNLAATNPTAAQTMFGDLTTVMTAGTGTTTMFGDVMTAMTGGSGATTMFGGLPNGLSGSNLGTLFGEIGQLAGTDPNAAQTMFGDLTTIMNAGTGNTTMFGDVLTKMDGGSSANVTMFGGLPQGLVGVDQSTLYSDIASLASTSGATAQTLFSDIVTVMTAGTGATTMYGDVMATMNGGSASSVTMYGGLPTLQDSNGNPVPILGPSLPTLFSDINTLSASTGQTLFGDLTTIMNASANGTTTMFGDILSVMNGSSADGSTTMYGGLPSSLSSPDLNTLFGEINTLATDASSAQTLFDDLVIQLNGYQPTIMNPNPSGSTTMFGDVLAQAVGGPGTDTMFAGLPTGLVDPNATLLQMEITTLDNKYGLNLTKLLSPTLTGGSGYNWLFGEPGATLIAGPGVNSVNYFYAALPPFNDTGIPVSTSTAPTTLKGGPGTDTFLFDSGNLGQVVVSKPGGNATFDFTDFPAVITLNMSQTTPQVVSPGNLTLTLSNAAANTYVVGTRFADQITGGGTNQFIESTHHLDNRALLTPPVRSSVYQVVFLDFGDGNVSNAHVYTPDEQQAIMARMATNYSAFQYTFTLTAPASGPYATIFFNKSSVVNNTPEPGGQSDEVDFRNLHLGGTATVEVNEFMGSGPGQLSPTSANFVAISATIASHELGHLSGLLHSDTSGPIGNGAHNPPGAGAFRPTYPGPMAAFETTYDIMASPASVGSTLAQTTLNPSFGLRDDIKLAFATDGTVVPEQSGAHQDFIHAQSVALQPLAVPNTLRQGLDAGKTPEVTAVDVTGTIDLPLSTQTSQDDYYSFQGRAGDLMNFELMSATLPTDRTGGHPFDTVLDVYDSSGALLGYYGSPTNSPATNDDRSESTDSSILDLHLPYTGTYYVEVDSFSDATHADTQYGNYELFMYQYDAAFTNELGHTLIAGTGNEELKGGAGNDTFVTSVALPGQDTVIGGGGSDTIQDSGATNYLLTNAQLTDNGVVGSGTVNLTGIQNAVLTGSASGTTFDFEGWTGNAAVVGVGGYNTLVVNRNDPLFTLTNSKLTFSDGTYITMQNIQNVVLTGRTGSVFDVSGYTGTDTLNVLGGTNPVYTPRGVNFTTFEGVAGPPSTIGTLTDQGTPVAKNYTVSVNWGDNQTSAGTSTTTGTTVSAQGSHPYAVAGSFTVTTKISQGSAFSVIVSSTATVQPSIIVLNPSAAGALSLQGSSSLTIAGAVVVDSNSPTALSVGGSAQISAGSILVVGGVSASPGALNVTPATGVSPVADPLAGLAVPGTGTTQNAVNLTSGSLTINPGVYAQISVSGNGTTLSMNPGVYIIKGGGFTVSNSANVSGAGVVIYNAGSKFPAAGGTFGAVSLGSSGTVSLSAPTSGPYTGVLIFQARDNSATLSLNAQSEVGLNGVIYAQAALLSLGAGSLLHSPVIVNTLSVSGHGGSPLTAAGFTLAPDGDTLGSRDNLYVYVNDPAGQITADERARLADAVGRLNTALAPEGVSVTQVGDPGSANVVVDTGVTSASGGSADGVLGSFSIHATLREITLVQGWNWYTGTDSGMVRPDQYDFEAVLLHEFGHALGLDHSDDPNSVMYESLPTGITRRSITPTDFLTTDQPTAEPDLLPVLHGVTTLPPQTAAPTPLPVDPGATDRRANLIVTEQESLGVAGLPTGPIQTGSGRILAGTDSSMPAPMLLLLDPSDSTNSLSASGPAPVDPRIGLTVRLLSDAGPAGDPSNRSSDPFEAWLLDGSILNSPGLVR